MNLFAHMFGGSLLDQNPGWFSYQHQVPTVKPSCQFYSDRADDDDDQRYYADRYGQVYEIVEHPWYGTVLLPVKAAPSPVRRQKCRIAAHQKREDGNKNAQHEKQHREVQQPKLRQILIDGFDNPEPKAAQETKEEMMDTVQNEPVFTEEESGIQNAENAMDETYAEDETEARNPIAQTDMDAAMDCNEQESIVLSGHDQLTTSQIQRISGCVHDLEQQFHEAMKDMSQKQPGQQYEKIEKELIKYEELLLQQLLALDSAEIRDDSHPSVREMRKQQVQYVQHVLKQVDEKRATLLSI